MDNKENRKDYIKSMASGLITQAPAATEGEHIGEPALPPLATKKPERKIFEADIISPLSLGAMGERNKFIGK